MKKLICLFTLMITLIVAGCSGNTAISTAPGVTGDNEGVSSANHAILGFWQMSADPVKGTLDVVELRETAMHLNALHFLEPPPQLYLTLESTPVFSGNKLDVDIGLRHPFLGLNQYTGFDVCGIVITNGSVTGYTDPDIVIAGPGDTRLIDCEGLTRWWNPREFPPKPASPIQGYIDGLMGTPDSAAGFTATLNGYMYFADGLEIGLDASTVDPDKRGSFSAGQQNIRHYRIALDGGLVFNYAIDACWAMPKGSPIIVPDSFSPSANRPEPFFVFPWATSNTLWYKDGDYGGSASFNISVYDWFDADLIKVTAECPGVFEPVSSSTPVDGGQNFSIYQIDITNPILSSNDPIYILFRAECNIKGYQGNLPGKPITTYAPLHRVFVDNNPPIQQSLIWHEEGLANSEGQPTNDDIEPALTIDGTGLLRLSFFWWYQDAPDHWTNRPRFVTSDNAGLTFGPVQIGQWDYHGVSPTQVLCFNGKYTVGPNGQAWQSYNAPCGHTLHPNPTFAPYTAAASHSGTPIGHAGEMLYTSEGYPMMFGDNGGKIDMRRGDFPNEGGTGTWPVFEGTLYNLVNEGWLSIVRSTGKTSDGICRLVYWKEGIDGPIRMLSSDDISGTSWTNESIIQDGAAEIWVGAHDPSLWIDEKDHYHVAYAGDTWMGTARLVYAYSDNGIDWINYIVGNAVEFDDLELHDTGVVTINAFDEQYIFLVYEYKNEIWCQYAKPGEPPQFSDPIKVNMHYDATLPDLYPNGGSGVVFAYEADGDTATRDIFYRMCEFIEE